jgi:hypothetical protein
MATQIASTDCYIGLRSLHEFDRWDNFTVDPHVDPDEDPNVVCEEDPVPTCPEEGQHLNEGGDECLDDETDEVAGSVVMVDNCKITFTRVYSGHYCDAYSQEGIDDDAYNQVHAGEIYRISLGDVGQSQEGVFEAANLDEEIWQRNVVSKCDCEFVITFSNGQTTSTIAAAT